MDDVCVGIAEIRPREENRGQRKPVVPAQQWGSAALQELAPISEPQDKRCIFKVCQLNVLINTRLSPGISSRRYFLIYQLMERWLN